MIRESFSPVLKCRSCGSTDLVFLFSLGGQYLSDFVAADKIHEGAQCPIELELCRSCTLVQSRFSPPQNLYSQKYWFKSSSSATNRAALADVARAAERVANLKAGDVVLDIGSNDGTLLRSYTVSGLFKIGVEPAANLAKEGNQGVDLLIKELWNYEHIRRCFLSQAGRAIWGLTQEP